MIDNREAHEASVSSCEGDKCKPKERCMLSLCIALTPCKVMGKCLAREIYCDGKTTFRMEATIDTNKKV
jgi:hypothetical protein